VGFLPPGAEKEVLMESVWSYPSEPTLEPDRRRILVEFAGVVVADTTGAMRLLERGLPPSFYVPPEDTRTDLLVPCASPTLCPVKGEAQYWTIRVDSREAQRAAWSYPDPFKSCAAVRNHFAFYASRVDRCSVDGEVVRTTDSAFYGGWITTDLEGPFVGDTNLSAEFSRLLPRCPIPEERGEAFEELARKSFALGQRYLEGETTK
jgi:uncharacterized protein (DUF427 family)